MTDTPKKLASIPDRYSPDFADRLDGRTNIAKAILGRIEAIETDLGGADGLSHARRSLIRRAVWLEAVIEHSEQRLAAGEGVDLGGHTQAINSLLGLYRLLGLDRKSKPIVGLQEYLARRQVRQSERPPETAPEETTADTPSAEAP